MLYIKNSNIGDIMKKILLILALLSSTFVAAQERSFQAFFGIKTDNPLAVVSALDSFSNANCPGTSSVRLMQELFNGPEETTHTIIVTFPNKMSYLMWANNWTNCPAAGKFLSTMNEISEQTYQFMGMPLMGDGDPNADQVFQVFLMDVKDPASYAKAYSNLMSSGEQCAGSWALIAMGPGMNVERYGTHFAYCGFKDIDVYLDGYMSNVTPTKEYSDFIKKVSNIRELKAVNMAGVVKDWAPQQ